MTLGACVTLATAAASAVSAGCAAAPDGSSACPPGQSSSAAARQALYGAGEGSAYLALSERQRNAVVRIALDVPGQAESAHCSGVVIGPALVLTAKHCVDGVEPASAQVSADPRSNENAVPYSVESIRIHADSDLALLALEPAASEGLGADPVAPVRSLDEHWIGRRALLAGYGENDLGLDDARLFAIEAIDGVDGSAITTAGFGLSGGCLGDSGGPLLARADDGSVVVLGILSSGSVSCRGVDHFARVDRAIAWLDATGAAVASSPDCGELSLEGRCFDGHPVWCEHGRTVTSACAVNEICGYSEARAAYRCVDASRACSGDAFGTCASGRVIRCAAGQPEAEECSACGARCGFEPTTGRAACIRS